MRLALFQMGQETDTFNPSPTTMHDFASFGLYEGQESSTSSAAAGPSAAS